MRKVIIFAQFFGILGSISMMLSNWQKDKRKMMLFLILDSVLYFIQYIILKAYVGAFTNVISFIRVILASRQEKMNSRTNKIALYSIIFLYTICGIFTCKTIIDVLPILATLIYTIFLWQKDIQKIRIGSSIMFFMWMIYDVVVEAYVGAGFELFLFLTAIISIIKLRKLNNNVV